MKKTFSMILAALMVAGTATTAFAADNAPAAMSGDEVRLAEVGTLIIGPMPLVSGTLEEAMDGDPDTVVDFGVEGGEEYWVGVKMDQPTILTRFEAHGPGHNEDGSVIRPHVVYGQIVEGSNDGVNWEFILQLGDVYSEYEEYAWDMEDGIYDWFDEDAFDGGNDPYEDDDPAGEPVAYTYFRTWNDCKGVAIFGDVQFYGYVVAAETEAPETEAPETEAPETEAPETEAPETAAPETAAPETAAPETAAPETAAPETAAPETAAPVETAAPETAAPVETVAPETAAPETAAPVETAAPETAAPVETAAPETAAPVETAAPETAAPETTAPVVTPDDSVAPQTFDFGVIAAVAAVVSAAGYVVAKKRK